MSEGTTLADSRYVACGEKGYGQKLDSPLPQDPNHNPLPKSINFNLSQDVIIYAFEMQEDGGIIEAVDMRVFAGNETIFLPAGWEFFSVADQNAMIAAADRILVDDAVANIEQVSYDIRVLQSCILYYLSCIMAQLNHMFPNES
ncbi:MAG: hypothetical protein ABW189_00195 [Rickettsiales bacterium]